MDRVGGPRIYSAKGKAEPGKSASGLSLDAESEWVVEGSKLELDAVVADLGEAVCQRLSDGVALLGFGNSVGRIERAGGLGPLIIHSGKWTEQDYHRLLEDLSRIAASLPFAQTAPTSLPYERSVLNSRDVLYHAFVWLRHALLNPSEDALHDALEGILRAPHRGLVQTAREVSVDRAGRLGARALDDVASGVWPLAESPLGFAVGSRRMLPLRVREDFARPSADTAENRFVKGFLDECVHVVDQARVRLGQGDTASARRLREDCVRLTEKIQQWRRAPLWAEVGAMGHFPVASSVMQRRSEYRCVLRHHALLRLGSRVPLDQETTTKLLESKDIANLYELWATFAVIEELSVLLGAPIDSARVVTDHRSSGVSWGLIARWSDGTELAYNPIYSATKPSFHGVSRSVRLRPDIALYVPTGPGAGLHLFDAKFRLDGSLDADSEDETSFKRSDLSKMHAYRDAIPAARSAWVLYPGAESATYLDDARRSPLAGVGALSLRPEGGRSALRAVLTAATCPR